MRANRIAIDPGSRHIGLAWFCQRDLVDFVTLHPRSINEVWSLMLDAFDTVGYCPESVVIEGQYVCSPSLPTLALAAGVALGVCYARGAIGAPRVLLPQEWHRYYRNPTAEQNTWHALVEAYASRPSERHEGMGLRGILRAAAQEDARAAILIGGVP